ncbi:MAG: UbiA family prenyltransferase [Acidobacteriia bacterium]|nr:UbiA family prenyltransferase [Terriglobia bacterium]
MKRLITALRLIHLDSCITPFLAILIPVFLRSNDVALSFGRAMPILFIVVCTFIANDLADVEKDKVNHPNRPLPSGQITPTIAAILYFIALFSALFLIRHYIPESVAFWYYLLTAMSISYRYIVDCIPGLKAPYVAATAAVLPLMIASWYPNGARLYFVASATFLFIVGKEICLDIRDRPGDPFSFMHRFKPIPLAISAISLEVLGLLLLMTQVGKPSDFICLFAMVFMLTLSSYQLFKFANYNRANILMEFQLIFGIYFLT